MNKLLLGGLIILLSGVASAQPSQGEGSKKAEHEATRQQHQAYEASQRAENQPRKDKPARPAKPSRPSKPAK